MSGVFAAWDVPILELEAFRDLDAMDPQRLGPRQLRYLVSLSLLAPSTHNSVPQAYCIDVRQQRVEIVLRREHVLPASDPTGQEALISVGCAVENLALAAAQFGFHGVWHPDSALSWSCVTHADGDACARVGQLHFEPDAPLPEAELRRAALAAMRDRKVIRAEFNPADVLPEALRAELSSAATCSEGLIRLHVFDSDKDKFSWGKLDEMATKHKLEDIAFRTELGQCLLSDEDETSPRGMRSREFGLHGRLARELPAQLRGELEMSSDQLAFMARAGRVGLTSSSAVCALSFREHTPRAAVTAGRAYQHCALAAFRHGFAHAVHTAVCEVAHTRAMCRSLLLRGEVPAVVFRLGHPIDAEAWRRPHSSRPALADVMFSSLLHDCAALVHATC